MAEEPAFQLSIEALQGKWEHSLGLGIVTARGDTVYSAAGSPFPHKLQDAPEGDVTFGKWVTVRAKSCGSEIEWFCGSSNKRCQWSFESGLSDAEEDAAVDAYLNAATAPVEHSRRVKRRVVRPMRTGARSEMEDIISQCEASEQEKLALHEVQMASACQVQRTGDSASSVSAPAPPLPAGTASSSVPASAVSAPVAANLAEAQRRLEQQDRHLPASEILLLLDFLHSQPIDAQTMAATRIPQTVTAVRKRFAGHAEVSKVAKALLAKWRLLFQREEEDRVRRSS